MTDVWTHTVWTVKPGREEEFVRAWRSMAREIAADMRMRRPPTLLRDHDRPNVFISFAPWENVDAVTHFRSSQIFGRHVTRMGELLENLDAQTLDQVVEDG
jgi:heme-degrading monooxygenase HmoA